MRKKEYKFNYRTLTYEPLQRPTRVRRYSRVRRLLLFFLGALVVNIFVSFNYYTPKLERLEMENESAVRRYGILDQRITSMQSKLDELRMRDKFIYCPLFGADTLSVRGIYTAFPESRYANLTGSYAAVMRHTSMQLDAATRMAYRESLSLDQMQSYSKNKENMAASIPAIWPINRRDLKHAIGAYGRRLHPIYHRYIDHKGVDFGADKGDPVYATGNGKIEHTEMGQRRRGYGQQILINHGFGYETRYAHLSKILVTEGQTVRRGELIGYVGSTGGSTGPHLHYEVIYLRHNVNPINYFRRDMDEAEFERIVESAKATTFEALENFESN